MHTNDLHLKATYRLFAWGTGGEFVLINNADPEDSSRLTTLARENGWVYCGVFGLKDGIPRVESEVDPDSRFTMLYAGLAFCRIVSDRLRHPEKGDSVSWLRHLHALPDTGGAAMRKRFETLWAIRPEAALTVVRLMAREEGASAAAIGRGKSSFWGLSGKPPNPSAREADPAKRRLSPSRGF